MKRISKLFDLRGMEEIEEEEEVEIPLDDFLFQLVWGMFLLHHLHRKTCPVRRDNILIKRARFSFKVAWGPIEYAYASRYSVHFRHLDNLRVFKGRNIAEDYNYDEIVKVLREGGGGEVGNVNLLKFIMTLVYFFRGEIKLQSMFGVIDMFEMKNLKSKFSDKIDISRGRGGGEGKEKYPIVLEDLDERNFLFENMPSVTPPCPSWPPKKCKDPLVLTRDEIIYEGKGGRGNVNYQLNVLGFTKKVDTRYLRIIIEEGRNGNNAFDTLLKGGRKVEIAKEVIWYMQISRVRELDEQVNVLLDILFGNDSYKRKSLDVKIALIQNELKKRQKMRVEGIERGGGGGGEKYFK